MEGIEAIITARDKDLGELTVRRILPYEHCMIGPFIFFDHMGPASFPADKGVAVRPHPHIHLATVTYLFDGKIQHRDSLGSNQLIEPGAINWMVAGHGIVHSERTPADLLKTGSTLNGIQCWIALPTEAQDKAPSFSHYPKEQLPEFVIDSVQLKLLLGKAFQQVSPVATESELFYLEAHFPQGSKLKFPIADNEAAVYVVSGEVLINGQTVKHCRMAVAQPGHDLVIEAQTKSHLMFLGGKPVGQRYIYWNFVSSSKENIEQAMNDWSNGPGNEDTRFPKIPGDDQEFIPLPDEPAHINPKGTIM